VTPIQPPRRAPHPILLLGHPSIGLADVRRTVLAAAERARVIDTVRPVQDVESTGVLACCGGIETKPFHHYIQNTIKRGTVGPAITPC